MLAVGKQNKLTFVQLLIMWCAARRELNRKQGCYEELQTKILWEEKLLKLDPKNSA
jgi:hypothetical protein